MSNIPLARARLLALSEQLDHMGFSYEALQITRIVSDHLVRRPQVRRAPCKSPEVTLEMANEMIVMARNPSVTLADIAAAFRVNPGRVSEVLNGKRPR